MMVRIATVQDAEQLEILNNELMAKAKQRLIISEHPLRTTSKRSLLSMSRTEN